MKPVCKDW